MDGWISHGCVIQLSRQCPPRRTRSSAEIWTLQPTLVLLSHHPNTPEGAVMKGLLYYVRKTWTNTTCSRFDTTRSKIRTRRTRTCSRLIRRFTWLPIVHTVSRLAVASVASLHKFCNSSPLQTSSSWRISSSGLQETTNYRRQDHFMRFRQLLKTYMRRHIRCCSTRTFRTPWERHTPAWNCCRLRVG